MKDRNTASKTVDSKRAAIAAIRLAMVEGRSDERRLIDSFKTEQIVSAATDFGGNYIDSISQIIERAVVAARREGVIGDTHGEHGAVAGAAHEAIMQLKDKATGLNVGGKIGVARLGDHICVCVFFAVGLLHLNEIAIGLGHRAV
ncbi:MAG: HutP family protein [Fastidiosipilaceae bacterium]|jgi:hypothetical protein|nr:hut operon positive regulator HutP [Clostridiaceae bacterium]